MRSTTASWFAIVLIAFFGTPLSADVDLHSHLFMKSALNWYFNGNFKGEIRAKTWKDNLSSQVNPKILNSSGLKLVVVSLYSNPFFNLSIKQSIRNQVDLLHRWLKQNPDWILVKSPDDAWAAHRRNKKMIVLSLEGANGILDNDSDLNEFIDESGIRIVTPLHFTDDSWGGPAFLPGILSWMNPIARLRAMGSDKEFPTNSMGMTPFGLEMIKKLIARKVWIDLSHISDLAYANIKPTLIKHDHPFLFTHSVTRNALKAERGLSDAQLTDIQRYGGIVGVLPSEPYLSQQEGCGGVDALVDDIRRMRVFLNTDQIMLGSDTNAMPHLPQCSDDNPGYVSLGDYPKIWDTVGKRLEEPEWVQSRLDRFLNTWSKIYRED